MLIAKLPNLTMKNFQASGVKMAPRDIANKIVENIPANDLIEKLEVAGPGFVNIFIRLVSLYYNKIEREQ